MVQDTVLLLFPEALTWNVMNCRRQRRIDVVATKLVPLVDSFHPGASLKELLLDNSIVPRGIFSPAERKGLLCAVSGPDGSYGSIWGETSFSNRRTVSDISSVQCGDIVIAGDYEWRSDSSSFQDIWGPELTENDFRVFFEGWSQRYQEYAFSQTSEFFRPSETSECIPLFADGADCIGLALHSKFSSNFFIARLQIAMSSQIVIGELSDESIVKLISATPDFTGISLV